MAMDLLAEELQIYWKRYNMALISVIVPVYKVEDYIRRCVDSVLGQTFQDFELILVDDGSPDNCGTICDEYAGKDSRIHVIHQKNGGLSAARNTGMDWMFENSDSQWLTFVDSDDWIHSKYLEYLLKAVEDTKCMLGAGYVFQTAGDDFPEDISPTPVLITCDDYYCGSYSGGVQSIACAKLYAKELFRELRYPVGKLHEDEFTTYKAVYASGQVAVIPVPIYAYYQNPEGIVRSQWNPRRMDGVYAVEEQMRFAKQIQSMRLLEHTRDVYVWFLLEHLSKIHELPEQTEDIRQCRRDLEKRLREVLRDSDMRKKHPFSLENAKIYELAYPCPVFWEPLHFVSRNIRKLLKK